jgi:microcystin-dependent protein
MSVSKKIGKKLLLVLVLLVISLIMSIVFPLFAQADATQPYVGEIQMFAGNFAPEGWMFCDGTLLQISENPTLFQLIGTTYGGDGQSTFALPDLRGRVPISQGNGFVMGQSGGTENVTLTTSQMPATSQVNASSGPATTATPGSGVFLAAPQTRNRQPVDLYTTSAANTTVGSYTNDGGNLPHDNMPPYLGINYIISLYGVFPSQN